MNQCDPFVPTVHSGTCVRSQKRVLQPPGIQQGGNTSNLAIDGVYGAGDYPTCRVLQLVRQRYKSERESGGMPASLFRT